LLAEAQNLVNTVVLRWRGAKNIGIYGVFLFRECEKLRKHRLFDAFWGFAKTVDLTILGAPKSTNYKDNNDNDNRTKQQQL